MKFKFVESLGGIRTGENVVIDGFTYYVEFIHPTGRSAIVANPSSRMTLIVNTSQPIEEKLT